MQTPNLNPIEGFFKMTTVLKISIVLLIASCSTNTDNTAIPRTEILNSNLNKTDTLQKHFFDTTIVIN